MTRTETPTDRMPEIPAGSLSEAQAAAAEAFRAERGVPVFGPFVPLLRSPELMLCASRMGLYLRYGSALPLRISEFAILIVARLWNQQVEWHIHHPIALKAGVAPETAQALAEGRRPGSMSADEALAYAFSTELQHNRAVSEATYAAVVDRFGEQGAIDLTGINGYYALLAMTMNVARTALPEGASTPLPPLVP
ncbi:carboxymuconolactone decarboxylase family protein [Methylobacterium sp. NEAU K]|uniref:carboxymuconolactone decarboxylase family protein n=1 Tax=Methylobacterium sp. NEAU K TaxID=3064946 RepID=UPI0027370E41|nr:carboxymuconolactone decarboxylase family protein [Methylobacterium sp. NEAU K]MDP4006404.1 carboxymuconolactone decarboxylase family protein [Methylobacterium sp. NEAU K]